MLSAPPVKSVKAITTTRSNGVSDTNPKNESSGHGAATPPIPRTPPSESNKKNPKGAVSAASDPKRAPNAEISDPKGESRDGKAIQWARTPPVP
jgi:hypothetical protein